MQNNFSDLSELLGSVKMDGPINTGRKARWQKKTNDGSSNSNTSSSSLGMSLNTSQNTGLVSPKRMMGKSPGRPGSKSPKKTPGKQENQVPAGDQGHNFIQNKKTPSKTPKTSPRNKNGAHSVWSDRFIPSRSGTDFDRSHYLITQETETLKNEDSAELITQLEKERLMSENLHGGDINSFRVLEYKRKPPAGPAGHINGMRMIYTNSRTPGMTKAGSRVIPSCPEKILDAPDIMDDYYLNLLDWGKHNILAVALKNALYLWNESTGTIQQLLEMPGAGSYIGSVSWIQEGNILAAGDTNGTVQLWDCTAMKQVRSMTSHSGRVGSLSWNSYIISSGSRTGAIHHHDVRSPNFLVGQVNGHLQEVCGLKWCPDGRYLASGSNDNQLNVWAVAPSDMYTQSTPLYSFSAHQAAVKALAWCPWQHNILASGGGTADRHIRFWNCRLGTSTHSVDTKSQVCSIVWSPYYKELVSGHGYANHELIVWKYPMMDKLAELVGHTQRVLNLCLSPDGTTIMSAGADETIRLWKVFQKDQSKSKSEVTKTSKPGGSALKFGIR